MIKNNILLLDYCSESNRGDAAMQEGLLKLIYRYFDKPIVSIISVFGANQESKLKKEFDHSRKYPVLFFGGLKPTFYPIDSSEDESILEVEIKNALCFLLSLALLVLLSLKIPTNWARRLLPKKYQSSLLQMESADLVLWKGKNFRPRINGVVEVYRLLNQVFHPLVCFALSKPVACVSASVWHFHNRLSRKILREVFQRCFYVSLREKSSYDEVRELLGKESNTRVELLPDLSFAVCDYDKTIKAKRTLSDAAIPETIGLTLVDWKDEGHEVRENYKKTITQTIEYFVNLGSKIVIIPQVTKKWEANDLLISEILQAQNMSENISIISGNPSVTELISIYNRMDFLVATRMHSAIFASFAGTPLVAIPYDKGGKWNIIRDLGYRNFIINYSDLNFHSLLSKIEDCWQNKSSILHDVNEKIELNAKLVDKNITDILEFVS